MSKDERRRRRKKKRRKKKIATPPKKKEKKSSGAALRYASARRDRITKSPYVREIGRYEQPRWPDPLLRLPSLQIECLPRRKPALCCQTEHSHSRAGPSRTSTLTTNVSKAVWPPSRRLHSGFPAVVNALTFRLCDAHEFRNCRHCYCPRRRQFFSRHARLTHPRTFVRNVYNTTYHEMGSPTDAWGTRVEIGEICT